jgi:hypothetical protein
MEANLKKVGLETVEVRKVLGPLEKDYHDVGYLADLSVRTFLEGQTGQRARGVINGIRRHRLSMTQSSLLYADLAEQPDEKGRGAL